MRYISTRGAASKAGFIQTLQAGLAPDGGLYMPESWPRFSRSEILGWRELSYPELAGRVIAPFLGEDFSTFEAVALLRRAYRNFRHPRTAPLIELRQGPSILELFHGPTCAFKDFALQALSCILSCVLERKGQRSLILGATSGDTGAAALHAFASCGSVQVFMLYPRGRISAMQRRQMTTLDADNVFPIAVEEDFDTCQAMVKTLFNDCVFRREMQPCAVNSITWARILLQVPYYVRAWLESPRENLRIVVPSGNFGNAWAGWVARRIGVPLAPIVIASNANAALPDCLKEGEVKSCKAVTTLSPAMDIRIASNFERALFTALGNDPARTARLYQNFAKSGYVRIPVDALHWLRKNFLATSVSDKQTLEAMRKMLQACNYHVDPHTAVGIAAVEKLGLMRSSTPIVLATAHAAKFADTAWRAWGKRLSMPPPLQGLEKRVERVYTIAGSASALADFVRARAEVPAGTEGARQL